MTSTLRHLSKNATAATLSGCAAQTYHRRISYEREATWRNTFSDYRTSWKSLQPACVARAGNHPDGYPNTYSAESLVDPTLEGTQARCGPHRKVWMACVSDARCGAPKGGGRVPHSRRS